MKARMVFRTNKIKSKHTLIAYRSGWQRMWEYSPKLLEGWGVPEPGSWPETNQMGGVMHATPQDYRKHPISGSRLALLLEDAYEKGVTLANLKLMRKTCSYFFHLKTGKSGRNFSIVDGMMESLDPAGCGLKKKSLLPTKIITPDSLRTSFTSEWRGPDSGMCLIEFLQGDLSTWCWDVLGSRSGCDMTKIKRSENHHWDIENLVFSTAFLNGRSKLHMHKSGKRSWRAWFKCICPAGRHIRPPKIIRFNRAGNPVKPLPRGLCTTCPLVAAEIIFNLQKGKKRLFKRWNKKKCCFGTEDIGHVVNLARR